MTIEEFVVLLRRRWLTVVTVAVLATVFGLGVAALQPRLYEATATLAVTPSPGHPGQWSPSGQAYLSASGMQTYAALVISDAVVGAVKADLSLTESVEELRAAVTPTVPRDTFTITVAAQDGTAEQAQRIANATAERAVRLINEKYLVIGSGTKVDITTRATLPDEPVGPGLLHSGLFGLVVGLSLGLGAAVLREIVDNRVRRSGHTLPVAQEARR